MTVGIFLGDNLQKSGSTSDLPHMLPAKVETRNTPHLHDPHAWCIWNWYTYTSSMHHACGCINYTIPQPLHKHPLPMLISKTYTWHSPSVYCLSAVTRALLYYILSNVHSFCLSQWSLKWCTFQKSVIRILLNTILWLHPLPISCRDATVYTH
jgi:hypothetical protein